MQTGTFTRLAKRVVRRGMAEEMFIRSGINMTKPSDIRATLTERCNYRCAYCDHWRKNSYSEEMSFEEWKNSLLSVRKFVGRYAVQFLGGEPTIVPWFFDLAQFCSDNKIDWGVITNGSSLVPNRVRALVAAGPLNIDVSLDTRSADANDYLRGVRGAMARVSEGVRLLVEERRRTGRNFAIRIKPTVTRQTMATLGEIVDWAQTMPSVLVDFSPVRLWREDERKDMYPRGEAELEILRGEVARLIERKQAGAPIETSAAKLRAIVGHFAGEPTTHGVGSCRVGLRSIDIRPNGDVNHCFKFTRVGNLRESTMREIWESAHRRDIVDRTVACGLFKTTCSTACVAHRSFRQDVARGVRLLRSKPA